MTTMADLSLNTSVLSLGALLGTTGSNELIAKINRQSGNGTYFGSQLDPLRTGFQMFMTKIIEPARATSIKLFDAARQLVNHDVYKKIDSLAKLKEGMPPCMRLGVIYYPPIRRMLEEERITGYGINPLCLQDGDPYGAVLQSGVVDVHSKLVGKDGSFEVEWNYSSIDPEMTIEEMECLQATRDYFDKFNADENTAHLDFTDPTQLHC
jgi:hypothetical protein